MARTSEETGDRVFLTYEEAVAMLPDGETIHTFKSSGFALLGADWDRADILAVLKSGTPELAGPMATQMNHAIAIRGESLFIETRPDALPPA